MTLLNDIRLGLRTLLRSPGFSVLAVLTLALGIGVNTGIFSIVNGVLLRPLPYRNPDRIVAVWEEFQSPQGKGNGSLCLPRYQAWRDRNQAFDAFALYDTRVFILKEGDTPERIPGAVGGADLFSVLGVEPVLGRTFAKGEDVPGQDREVVLSYGLWERRFGGDANLVGRTIALEGGAYTVIGVMPQGFEFPLSSSAQLWAPFALAPSTDQGHSLHTYLSVARIRPELTLDQARSRMAVLTASLEQEREPGDRRGVIVRPLILDYVGWIRPILLILGGAVGFVLLIASANVANLLLARAMGRRTEVAIRAALGAGRGRLVRQFLAESLILATAGAALGLALGMWVVKLIRLSPYFIPRLKDVALDSGMLAICAGLSVLAAALFGLLPAIQASRADLQDALKDASRGSTARMRLRSALVVVEVALTLVLLIGAGLMLESLLRLERVKTGFQPDHLLSMRLPLPVSRYPDMQSVTGFYHRVLEQVGGLPSVKAAGMISRIPPNDWGSNGSFQIDGRPEASGADQPFAEIRFVSPNYFAAMGIPLLAGRFFGEQDVKNAPNVILINETLAHRYFPDRNPVGATINGVTTIVGVVGDVKNTGLARPTRPEYYRPYLQSQANWRVDNMYLVVRTELQPEQIVSAIRAEVKKLDPVQTVTGVRTMQQVLDSSTTEPRFQAWLIGAFAAMALVISMIGLYGVISYAVAQRTHEIGVRMALGASRGQVLGMVLRQALGLSALGIAIGAGTALALTRVLRAYLFETSPTDPVAFTAVSAAILAVIVLATYLPARRATHVDPMVALRYE